MRDWIVIAVLFVALAAATVLFAVNPAVPQASHDLSANPHNWMQDHKTIMGGSCCDPKDVFPLTHEVANALEVGSPMTIETPDGRTVNFTITIIYPSLDPRGVPWVTIFGCLFRNPGT